MNLVNSFYVFTLVCFKFNFEAAGNILFNEETFFRLKSNEMQHFFVEKIMEFFKYLVCSRTRTVHMGMAELMNFINESAQDVISHTVTSEPESIMI